MAITHTFRGSNYSCGYYAHIEDDQLVIGYNDPHEGGELYRGDFRGADKYLKLLKTDANRIYKAIKEYYELWEPEQLKPLVTDPEKVFKVRLYTKTDHVYSCKVKGQSEEAVIEKLCPKYPQALVIQHYEQDRTFVIYSDTIEAIEFC